MKYELLHDSIAKQVLNKTSADLLQIRKIKQQIEFKYENHLENNKLLLSNDDLDLYRPFQHKIKWSEEANQIPIFIKKSEERAAFERNEKIKNERRKVLIWVAGIAFLVAAALATIALYQRNLANKAEKLAKQSEQLANLSGIENTLSSAEKFLAEENFDEALEYLENADIAYSDLLSGVNQKNESVLNEIKNKKEILDQKLGVKNYNSLKEKWTKLKGFISKGDSLYLTNNDLNLKPALEQYKNALEIDPSANYIKVKIVSVEELLFTKFELWMYRAEQFAHYEQKSYADKSFNNATQLNIVPEYYQLDSTQQVLLDSRKKRFDKYRE